MAKETVTIEIEVTEKMRDVIIESIELKRANLNKVLTACMKEKQIDAAKPIVKEMDELASLISQIQEAE